MRRDITLTIFLTIVLVFFFPAVAYGGDVLPGSDLGTEISWYKIGMVQDLGGPGEPDEFGSDSGSVLFDDGMYKLWYSGLDGAHWRILYSTSLDGIIWTKYGVVVDLGPPGAMDDDYAQTPTVLKNEAGLYEMWYVGQATTSFGWKIMYATSDNGIDWNKHGVVLSKAGRGLGHPNVLLDDSGVYRMWYSEYDTVHWRIEYATSDDGIVWTEHGVALDVGLPGEPDSLYVFFPTVMVESDGTYLMYYGGTDGSSPYLDISYATSPDGEVATWDKMGLALPHGMAGEYDSEQAVPTKIRMREDGLHELWYTGYDGSRRRMMFALEVGEVPVRLRTNVVNDKDVLLNWTIHGLAYINHYLIYRSTDQRSFDFTAWIHNTSDDPDPLETTWIDADAAGPDSPQELYYIVRAVYSYGGVGFTSNTAGKWTKNFSSGLNTFSLPLEPFEIQNISWYADNISKVTYVRWMDSTGHWVKHYKGTQEGTNDIPVQMGKGYEIFLTSEARFTFCGYPVSMIRFHEGLGDSLDFRKSLSAQKDGSDTVLNWSSAIGSSEYKIMIFNERDQLLEMSVQPVVALPSTQRTWRHEDILSGEGEYHYLVVPVSSEGTFGSSTYSVGVVIADYQSGSDTFALPLKPQEVHSLDWYCDEIPDVVGMAYLVFEIWKFHAIQMPDGVYDVEVLQGEGYQISVDGTVTSSAFIGY